MDHIDGMYRFPFQIRLFPFVLAHLLFITFEPECTNKIQEHRDELGYQKIAAERLSAYSSQPRISQSSKQGLADAMVLSLYIRQ